MAEVPHRSIAFAKTTRPVVGAAVARERLFARLDGTPARTVAWISGPPGSGKTTLAASYVESRHLRSLWYQVDPEDDDVATFFHYLGHAARKLDSGKARDYPAYAPAEGADVGAFARRYFRQLFARAKGPFALVFDNLHAVPAQSALHKVARGRHQPGAEAKLHHRRQPQRSPGRVGALSRHGRTAVRRRQ